MADGMVSVGGAEVVSVGVLPEGFDLLHLPWFRRRVEAAVFPGIEEAPLRSGARGGVVVSDGRAARERVRGFAGVVAYRELRDGEVRSFLCEGRSSLRVVGLDQWENARALRECFAGGLAPGGLPVMDFVSLVDLLGDSLRSAWADCVESGVVPELRGRVLSDLRVLCFQWLLERVPAGTGGGDGSSAWDLVEALEAAGHRADGGSLGESAMLWLEMLRHGRSGPGRSLRRPFRRAGCSGTGRLCPVRAPVRRDGCLWCRGGPGGGCWRACGVPWLGKRRGRTSRGRRGAPGVC